MEKACLRLIIVNILYLKQGVTAFTFSISTENHDISIMTLCLITAVRRFHSETVSNLHFILPDSHRLAGSPHDKEFQPQSVIRPQSVCLRRGMMADWG